jgi:transglutaminase-like putative cysteine protease
MWLRTRCDLTFEIAVPTPFILMLRPRSGAHQWIAREEYRLSPALPAEEFTDVYGNLCQRLLAPPGPFEIRTAAEVMTADAMDRAPGAPFIEVQYLPDAVIGFLLPSRYCEADRLGALAAEITAGAAPGWDQVAAIEAWLRRRVAYVPGSSEIPESATEVLRAGRGVCRDLGHLGIALCRALAIPARLVVGYLHQLEPMDLHAWFEAFVGGRWYSFDATQGALRGGYVSLGYGRDAADVAVYTQFGPAVVPTAQFVAVERLAQRSP